MYDIELNQIQQNGYYYYSKYTEQIKDNRDLVKLGLYCTKYCFQYNTEETKPYAQKYIDLVEKWLIDPKSVTQ